MQSDLAEARRSQRNLLAANGLSPQDVAWNEGLSASFRTSFFGFIDSKRHSRFVLRILILLSHLALPQPISPMSLDNVADGCN